jgi:DNA-binding transcriptional LysR family regulator
MKKFSLASFIFLKKRVFSNIFINKIDYMRPDLDALEALDAVVVHGGVAQAAAHLHKVQSAVTYQLRKLERQLGVALLDRSGYRVCLTAAGEAVLVEGRRLLAQAEHLRAVAQEFEAGYEPRLTLVVDGIMRLEPVFQALKMLVNAKIPTRVQVRVEFLGGVQHRFETDSADLMLVKDFLPRSGLQAQALPELVCILCAAPEHPLAGMKRVSLSALHDHVELSVQDSSGQGADRHMFGGDRVFYLSGFIPKKQALLMGLGFGWMPHYLCKEELRAGALREIKFAGGSRYRFTPQLVQRRDRRLGRAATQLVALLEEGYA